MQDGKLVVSQKAKKANQKSTKVGETLWNKLKTGMVHFKLKLHCSVRSRSVRLWRDDLHDHRGGLRRCLDPEVGQEGLRILEDQINGIELTKKLVNIV